MLCRLLLNLIMCNIMVCTCTPLMLTVHTQSVEHITHLALNAQHNSQRTLLGALEATQTSVVDVENIDSLPYEVTHVQSVPTLSLLDSVNFDNVTEEWSFAYGQCLWIWMLMGKSINITASCT